MSNNEDSHFWSLIITKEGKGGQPFATNEAAKNHEVDEVNFGRPPRFSEHEEEEEEEEEDEVDEAFVILGSPQKFESKRAEIAQGFERCLIQEECPYHKQN